MKVSIVGAGIVGLSLARELLRRKVEVVVFDQGAIPNPINSSMDEHRLIRHSYIDIPGYGAMAPAAFRAFEALWRDFGQSHYLATDAIYLNRGLPDRYALVQQELDSLGIAHRPLSLDELRRDHPHVRLDNVESAFRAEGSGMLFAERIVRDLAALVAAEGAELHPHSLVSDIDPEAGTLVANRKTFSADLIVVATGAWLGETLPAMASRAVASRQLMLYLRAPAIYAESWARSPVLIDNGYHHGTYILPPRGGTRLKIGDHRFSLTGSGSDTRAPGEADLAPVLAAARQVLNDFESYASIERKVCYYTVTEDERFIVEPCGAAAWVASACSGHGFKFAPLTGKILAKAICGEITAAEASALAAGLGNLALLD